MRSLFLEALRLLDYRINRKSAHFSKMPMSVTVSVTNICNSRCKTCYIWQRYRDKPELRRSELATCEFDSLFESLGKNVAYLVLSGGEPFIREDIARICISAYEQCHPKVITIPTNALLTTVIKDRTKQILDHCPDTVFTVNVSLDGAGAKHDEIRGVKGNIQNLMDTYSSLVLLKKEFKNLNVGLHSVLSVFNQNDFAEIYELVGHLQPDSYIVEVAEERTELFNRGSGVAPKPDKLATVLRGLQSRVKCDYLSNKSFVVRLVQASRLLYYEEVPRILEEKRQLRPCYAGFASCQITPYGDVWPCCVLGYDQSMGNIRDCGYDFRRLWSSERAHSIRKYIRDKRCSCPLANAWYTSTFCQADKAIKVMATLVASYFQPQRKIQTRS